MQRGILNGQDLVSCESNMAKGHCQYRVSHVLLRTPILVNETAANPPFTLPQGKKS